MEINKLFIFYGFTFSIIFTIIGYLLAISLSPIILPPYVDPVTQEGCRLCEDQFNLSFDNSVEAYYWLTANEQTEPGVILMKWRIHNACEWNCTIPNQRESAKMVLRVTKD